MALAVRAFDEVPGRPRQTLPALQVASRSVTAGALIRQRVDLELARRAAEAPAPRVRDAHPDEVALHPGRGVPGPMSRTAMRRIGRRWRHLRRDGSFCWSTTGRWMVRRPASG